jgi:hypothetical protein
MKPSQTAQALRRIAANIQNSKNPDRNLVARDLKKILAAISGQIVINMYDKIAIKTNDVRGQLKAWMADLINRGQEVIGLEGEAVTLDNIDSQLANVEDDMLGEAFDSFLVTDEEGSQGVGVGFVSSDRQYIVFPWPEELAQADFIGNGDPDLFMTSGAAPGTVISGQDGTDNPDYLKWCDPDAVYYKD